MLPEYIHVFLLRLSPLIDSILVFFVTSGEMQAYWKQVFNMTRANRITYGTLPNKSDFDATWVEKRIAAAEDPTNEFNPYSNIEHYIWCAMENIMFHWCTRGANEPSSLLVGGFF